MSLITSFVTGQLSAKSQEQSAHCRTEQHKENWKRIVKAAQLARTHQAEQRYKRVMQDWTPTGTIEARLGYARMVGLPFLRKMLEKGLVERRNRGGKTNYVKKEGFDWRWVNGN